MKVQNMVGGDTAAEGSQSGKAPVSTKTPVVQSVENRLYGDDETTEAVADTKSGTPGDAEGLGADDDDALATAKTDDEDSDTDDGTPDEDESEDGGFEQRYKDLQAEFTTRTQELSQLKTESAESQAEVTRTVFELQDRYAEQEQIAGFLLTQAQGEYQNLQRVNVQQLNQQQYAQWQQANAVAAQKAQQTHQAFEQIKARAKDLRDGARSREAAISRASLVRSIDNFDEVYPKLGEFATSKGVNPQVFRELTDPGLIKIIHEAMQSVSQPDVIKKVVKTGQTGVRTAQKNAKSRFTTAQPKTLAQRLYKE